MAANVDINKMKKLLALSIPQVQVAMVLGCDESYVSQQLADERFAAEVAAMKIARLEEVSNRDEKLNEIEDVLLDKIKGAVNWMTRPHDLLAAFKVVSSAPRRALPAGIDSNLNLGQVVTVVVPQSIAINFIQNQQGEIIEANGRSLATLSPHVLKQMAASKPKQLTEVTKVNEQYQVQVKLPAREAINAEAAVG